MKILRKNDEFKKMPDSCMDDILKIDVLIEQGWNYCAKSIYKEYFKVQKSNVNNNSELESNEVKKTKSGKNSKKESVR